MTYTLKLTGQHIKYISDCLIERPYKDAAPIIYHIQQQINEQNRTVITERPSGNLTQ